MKLKISWVKYEKDDLSFKIPERLGFDVFKLVEPEQADSKIKELINKRYDTIILTNEIAGFCLQPTFMLAPGLKYKADFIVFNSDNSYEVVDVKGVRTKEYIAKKKVFEDKYHMKIKEI